MAKADLLWWEHFLQRWNGTMFFRHSLRAHVYIYIPCLHQCLRFLWLRRSGSPLLLVSPPMAGHLGGSGHHCQGACTYCYSGRYLGSTMASLKHLLSHRRHGSGGHFAHQIWYFSATPALMLLLLFCILSI